MLIVERARLAALAEVESKLADQWSVASLSQWLQDQRRSHDDRRLDVAVLQILRAARNSVDALCEFLAPFVRNSGYWTDPAKRDDARSCYAVAHDVLKLLDGVIGDAERSPLGP